MGYLICEKCGGYYELKPGESPEDFDKCECGGKLKYFESLNENEKTSFCPNCGIKTPNEGTFCENCGYNLKSVSNASLPSENEIPIIINWKLIIIAVIICFLLRSLLVLS